MKSVKKFLLLIFISLYLFLNIYSYSETLSLNFKKSNFKAKNFKLEIIDLRYVKNENTIDVKIDKNELADNVKSKDLKKNDKINDKFDNKEEGIVIIEDRFYYKENNKIPDAMSEIIKSAFKSFLENGDNDLFLKVYILDGFKTFQDESLYINSKVEVNLYIEIYDHNNILIFKNKGYAKLEKKGLVISNGQLDKLYFDAHKKAFINALIN